MSRIAPVLAPDLPSSATATASESHATTSYCSSGLEDITSGQGRTDSTTKSGLAHQDAIDHRACVTGLDSPGLAAAPDFAPTFDLLRNHIVGNGHRAGRYARMNPKGDSAKYTTIHEPLADEQIAAHILGRSTYAAIVIGADGLTSAACIELDADSLQGAGRVLAAAQTRQIVAFSIAVKGAGNHDGSHTWLLFAERVKPANAAHLARQIAAAAGYADAEIWPKGNAIRLPFGVHTHTQKRGRLLLQSGEVYDLDEADQLSMGAAAVAGLPLNSAPPEPPKVEPKPAERASVKILQIGGPSPIEQFNASHDIADLLSSYGAVETRDGWACNCGVQHSHETQLTITSQGKLVSYSTNCGWAPHYLSGQCQDAFGLYCLVEHNGNVKAAVAALLPPKAEKKVSDQINQIAPTPAQIEARRKDAERKRAARRQAAADLRADVMGRAAVDAEMPPQAMTLLDIHLTVAGQRGWHRASVARMAEMAGYGERWVQRFNEYLIANGYITRSQPDPTHTAIWTFTKSDTPRNETPQTDDDRVIADTAVNDDRSPVLEIDPDLKIPVDACERAPEPPPERACDPQPDADGFYSASDYPLPRYDETRPTSQPPERMALVYDLRTKTDDELQAWIASFAPGASNDIQDGNYSPPALDETDQLDAPGASYVGEPLITNDPRAVPPWLRETGDIAITRRPDADAIPVEQPTFDLPEPEPLVRCPPSDPKRQNEYYALLGKAKKSTTSPAQRRKLELMAAAMEEWVPASEAAARRPAHKPSGAAVRMPQAVGSSERPAAAAAQAAFGL